MNSFEVTQSIQSCHSSQFQWPLKNFHNIKTETFSPDFSAEGCDVKWRLSLNFGNSVANKIFTTLHRSDKTNKTVEALLFIDVQNSLERTYSKTSIEGSFPPASKSGAYFKKPTAFKSCRVLDNATSAIPIVFDSQLIIKGSITMWRCCKVQVPTTCQTLIPDELMTVFKNQEFCDVSLKVGDYVIGAHKVILCARSPVLKKMFENNLEESKSSVVKFNDITKELLDTFLDFIYSGQIIEQKFDSVISLYSMSNKYEVSTLQIACRDILKTRISERTVLSILKLSDLHKDIRLMKAAFDFICDNFEKVSSTSGWEDILDFNPRLASLTLKRLTIILSRQRNLLH